MGAAQPLNTTISVFRRLRTYRNNARHTTVKHLTTATWDDQVVSIPGEETEVLEVRDAAGTYAVGRTDAFRFGHAIVVEPRAKQLTKNIIGSLPFTKLVALPANPREVQIENVANHQTDDLYGEAAAAGAGHFIAP